MELAAQIGQHGDVAGTLNDHGAGELSERLQATAGSAALPLRPIAHPSLASKQPAAQVMPLVFGSGGGSQGNVYFASSTEGDETAPAPAAAPPSKWSKSRARQKEKAQELPKHERDAYDAARKEKEKMKKRKSRLTKK